MALSVFPQMKCLGCFLFRSGKPCCKNQQSGWECNFTFTLKHNSRAEGTCFIYEKFLNTCFIHTWILPE